jgi:hypothetical protein
MSFGFRAIFMTSLALLLVACEPPVQKGTLQTGAEKVSGFEVVYLSRLPTPMSGHSTAGPVSPLDVDKMLSEASRALEAQIGTAFQPLLEKDGLYRKVSIMPAPTPYSDQALAEKLAQMSFSEPSALILVPISSNIYCGGFLSRACRVDMKLNAVLFDTRARRITWAHRQDVIATPAFGSRGDVLGPYWQLVAKSLRDDRLMD